MEPTKSAVDQVAEWARLGRRVGWRCLRLGVGHATPSGQIPRLERAATVAAVRYQHVMADRDAATAVLLNAARCGNVKNWGREYCAR
jgi:hypothetical protein